MCVGWAGIGEKAGYHISFIDFMKIGFPVRPFSMNRSVLGLFWVGFGLIWAYVDSSGHAALCHVRDVLAAVPALCDRCVADGGPRAVVALTEGGLLQCTLTICRL